MSVHPSNFINILPFLNIFIFIHNNHFDSNIEKVKKKILVKLQKEKINKSIPLISHSKSIQICQMKKEHNLSTFTFISQILRTQFKHRTWYLPRHVCLASLTCLRGESLIKDSKLQLSRITQPATYNSHQWSEPTVKIQNEQGLFLMSLRLHAKECTHISFLIFGNPKLLKNRRKLILT